MKTNFLKLSILFIITGFLSCQKDQKTEILTSHETEIRSINWCDGGPTSPPAVSVLSFYKTGNYCCYTFRFANAYEGKYFVLTTTDWDFETMTGDPGDNHSYPGFIGDGVVENFCFIQQGSHFLIQIVVNGFTIACNEFENLCED